MVAQAQPLALYNTLKRQTEPFEPLHPSQVRMYVCGPTVYDDAHLGHARCYITWDVLYRLLRFLGFQVTYVRNVTDIDDKILQKAAALNVPYTEVAERYYQSFSRDMKALNVLTPTQEPKATEHIDEMLRGIQRLLDRGMAYTTEDGSVYFRVAAFERYGDLSNNTLENLQSGARVEVDSQKENPLDFALWKGVKDPKDVGFEAPWGRGRPGWHIECSAMIHRILGEQIDIHAGGADLIFPHHSCELAQSESWTEKSPFVRYWLHNGFVNVSGEKMSKSLGNFSTIQAVLKRYTPNAIRYFLLTHHYRMPVDFHDEALQSAENRIIKVHRTFRDCLQPLGVTVEEVAAMAATGPEATADTTPYLNRFTEAMTGDLNTPQALAVLNEVIGSLHDSVEPEALRSRLAMAVGLFSVLGFDLEAAFETQTLPIEQLAPLYQQFAEVTAPSEATAETLLERLIQLRAEAKAMKDWGKADAIRNRLSEAGIQLKDNKDGTTTWELLTTHDRHPVS